jgi:hypothetical protein
MFCFVLFFVFFVSIFFLTFFFFARNKAQTSLFSLLIYILMLCGVFALGLDLWVMNVNDILTFGLRKMSFSLRVLCSQGRGIMATYALDYVCLDLILNLMISHRLADFICNGLIGTLASAMICFRAFCFICKSFHS